MSDPIPYDEMRRLLGLPVLRARVPAPWTVRKIVAGEHAGRWGVWSRRAGSPEPVETFRIWSDAISRVCDSSDVL